MSRTVHILMAGPIRPSIDYIEKSITTIKTLLQPFNIVTHLVTWKHPINIKSLFDRTYYIEEPTEYEIHKKDIQTTQNQSNVGVLMSSNDCYLCDVCSTKTFYDAECNYSSGDKNQKTGHPWPDSVGDMAVICADCAENNEIKIIKRFIVKSATIATFDIFASHFNRLGVAGL